MSSLLPVALYGLKVPADDVMVPALNNVKSTVSATSLRSLNYQTVLFEA